MPKLAIHPSTRALQSIRKRGFRVDQEYPIPELLEKQKKSSKTQNLKNVWKYAKIINMPFDQRSLIHQEAWFPPCFVGQNQPKKTIFFCLAIFNHFQTKMFKSETTSINYFSPRIPNL